MSRETEQWKKQLDREKENKNKIASKYQIKSGSYYMTHIINTRSIMKCPKKHLKEDFVM